MPLPPLLPATGIRERLQDIFPEGTANRNFVTREMAARTVFVMLYVGTVDGERRWLRPNQVTRMTDAQAALAGDPDRHAWWDQSLLPAKTAIAGRWYAADTREPIRDETLREGLVSLGAVVERTGLPTTSPKGRYALADSFAALFNPALEGAVLEATIREWSRATLNPAAHARIELLRREQGGEVVVTFPNREARRMAAGPSSELSKAVIEDFARRFLERPTVLWLTESRTRVVAQDADRLRIIGLNIPVDRVNPDVILADLATEPILLVFVEVVATAGAVNKRRRDALRAIAAEAGFERDHVAFVTAYRDRDTAAFKTTAAVLAWRSFAWFMSEPKHIVVLRSGSDERQVRLSELMQA